jgi:hypothetical protein
MLRRTALRLLCGLLLGGVAACGSPAPTHTVEVPTNRFPKAGLPAKKADPKAKPPAKSGP